MISFEKFTLKNGLKVILHQELNTPMAVVNVLYDVGSRDEDPDRTGFAHLFEHLMFGGSANIKNFDEELQQVGGQNNAFTSTDITNYYSMVPAGNLETALWLESDRMLSLNFDPKVLKVQKQVVVEEFKQRYLNQPYGDIWLKLRPLAYKHHPYQWPTIGKEVSHIEEATMEDVKSFFYRHYRPNNAILCVAGNIDLDKTRNMIEKWFGDIPMGTDEPRALPDEPEQKERRSLEVTADVPQDALYCAFPVAGKTSPEYYTADLLSDLLGRGKSSLLYRELVKNETIFNQVGAFTTDSLDPGLLMFTGRLHEGVTMEKAYDAFWETISDKLEKIDWESELFKVKNQARTTVAYSRIEVMNRAMSLCYSELMGDIDRINTELNLIEEVSVKDVREMAEKTLVKEKENVLFYHKEEK